MQLNKEILQPGLNALPNTFKKKSFKFVFKVLYFSLLFTLYSQISRASFP